tara:strand:+ start:896 stop:1420 length:525 start_codon:yes stop_codon:yes gene_type:complete
MEYPSLSKSPSTDSFFKQKEYITIEFEGDGNLGIFFKKNKKNKMEVSNIKNGTVANEYYELHIGMTVNKVNEYYFKDFEYDKFMKLIGIIWNKYHEITIEFYIPDICDNEIYKFLQSINCEMYYDIFEKLGAHNKSDLIYIENDDLVNIEDNDRKKIMKTIKRVESDIFEFDDI